MKVLLIQSYLGGNEPLVYPIGLACLKASLRGHDVRALDTNTLRNPFEDISAAIEDFAPDVIGISLRNIDSTNKRKIVFYYKYLKDTLDTVKNCTNARVVIGGSGFSIHAREIMESEPRIDLGVYLEGEETFPELLENLETPEKVKSVFYRKNGEVLFSGAGPHFDLSRSAMPDMDVVPVQDYTGCMDSIGIETKRGCALNCIYCIYGFLNGRKYRSKTPRQVVDEVERVVRKHNAKRFMFVDSVFNIPRDYAEDICREMVDRNLKVKWSAWFSEKGLDGEFVDLVQRAGCDRMMLSPDGFTDEVLAELGKNITRKDILSAYEVLKKTDGLDISYNFFKNPPGQSLENFIGLALFCLKAKRELGSRVHFEFNSLRIEPHTKLFDIACRQGVAHEGESLLTPRYYTNPGTWFIESFFNLLMRLKGK